MSELKRTTHERRSEHVRAYEQVTEMYKDIKSTGGGSTLPRGVNRDSKVVIPSTCDFLCDVELTVDRALPASRDRVLLWRMVWETSHASPEDEQRIMDRVGQLFISRGIYPTQSYFRGKVVN